MPHSYLKNISSHPVYLRPHPTIKQLRVHQGHNIFPISWLHKLDYCEYQLYLENILGKTAQPTRAMLTGTREHKRMEQVFEKKAKPATLEKIVETSKEVTVLSREFRVFSRTHGIHGLIDEIQLTPTEFVIIDDKPKKRPFPSDIHQVYGYCLAFQEMLGEEESRTITAALRTRGTDKLFWTAPFDGEAKKEIIERVIHLHALLLEEDKFSSTTNFRKCRPCRFKDQCQRRVPEKE